MEWQKIKVSRKQETKSVEFLEKKIALKLSQHFWEQKKHPSFAFNLIELLLKCSKLKVWRNFKFGLLLIDKLMIAGFKNFQLNEKNFISFCFIIFFVGKELWRVIFFYKKMSVPTQNFCLFSYCMQVSNTLAYLLNYNVGRATQLINIFSVFRRNVSS